MIYLIKNWDDNLYYALDDGKIHNGSTGSVYIEEFICEMKIDNITLTVHSDLRYCLNGVHCGMSNIYLGSFHVIKNIPKWFYCYDINIPLLKQLTEQEFKEFIEMDNEPYLNYETRERGVRRFNKNWYIDNGYR